MRREFIASEYETTDKTFDILKLNSQPQGINFPRKAEDLQREMLISSLHASFNFLIRSPKKIPASTSAEIIHSGWNKIILNSKRRFPESISIAHPFFEWFCDPTNVLSERKIHETYISQSPWGNQEVCPGRWSVVFQ